MSAGSLIMGSLPERHALSRSRSSSVSSTFSEYGPTIDAPEVLITPSDGVSTTSSCCVTSTFGSSSVSGKIVVNVPSESPSAAPASETSSSIASPSPVSTGPTCQQLLARFHAAFQQQFLSSHGRERLPMALEAIVEFTGNLHQLVCVSSPYANGTTDNDDDSDRFRAVFDVVESHVFEGMLPLLWRSYQVEYEEHDDKLFERARALRTKSLADLGVGRMFLLEDPNLTDQSSSASTPLYESCVDALNDLPFVRSPMDGLRLCKRVVDEISATLSEYWQRRAELAAAGVGELPRRRVTLTADDLILLSTFVISRAGDDTVRNLYSMCELLDDFLGVCQRISMRPGLSVSPILNEISFGVEGFAFANFKAAVSFIVNSRRT
eukprot:TRINITY_DN104191_c0_g1_i1.p1 TRINITY_DN104191_c0_g1~~TRINITY_DN104191_c0_g1_i1.p1  ORF type:complete len:394 (-),score=158.77 TRINITY_DN104191_c0_g1_i1:1160-2299(-)